MPTKQNASTGPRTPEGKRRSSLNALKHGLTAVSPQAQEQIAQEFECNCEAVYEQMVEYYQPKDALENVLVRRISESLVKLERCRQMEKGVFSRNPDSTRPNISLVSVQRYERTADLLLHRSIATITRKRELERRKQMQIRKESQQSTRRGDPQRSPEFDCNSIRRGDPPRSPELGYRSNRMENSPMSPESDDTVNPDSYRILTGGETVCGSIHDPWDKHW
jgi:hypothetical protein